ncbi:hypothetical protein [Yoonia tamlensis]|uniref:hypothetical protein n=1 Tax=Yoonia tamlensis TaxID=390270 RepID=UPI000B7CA9FC|nr:hypothetical protein [Yoonia tamlensis]
MIFSPSKNRQQAGAGGIKFGVACAIGIICLLITRDRLGAMDAAAIWGALGDLSAFAGIAALLATWASLRTVGQYDVIWHEILHTETSPAIAARSGTTAIAFAQFVGFGTLSAALIRRHMLPQLSLRQIGAVSAAVPLAFFACWRFYAMAAGWWLSAPAVLVGLGCLGVALAAYFIGPGYFARLMGFTFCLPRQKFLVLAPCLPPTSLLWVRCYWRMHLRARAHSI